MVNPIRLALVGAGLFARDAHVPAIKALGSQFDITAVYSRTRATAESLQVSLSHPTEIYTDLDQLLQRSDIEAVNLLLPIDALPEAIEKSLAAGKHVISEKPITPNVAVGRRLITLYRRYPQLVWMVAENWRYEESFRRAGEIVRSGSLGKIITAHWALHLSTRPGNRYYETAWRRSGSFPGGFLLDGGVHHVAALRQVLGEIVSVSAEVRQMLPDLVPADTMGAVMTFASGVIGNYTVTYAAGAPFPTYLTVIGEQNVLRVSPGKLEVSAEGAMHAEAIPDDDNVQAELAAFAAAIRDHEAHRNPPLEGLRDVAVVEAMLKSGAEGGRIRVENLADLENPS